MADIFLSYSSGDRDRVQPLVEALQDDGFTVWWDRDIRPGPSFDREIEQAIDAAQCMVVVWSAQSVESEWVRSEVEEGVRRGILVPVAIDAVMPPLAYRRRQTADLSAWDGERDGQYAQLLMGIRATMEGASPDVLPESGHGGHARAHSAARPSRRKRRVSLGTAVSLGLVVALGAAAVAWIGARWQGEGGGRSDSEVVRLEMLLPEGRTIERGIFREINITPDGKVITFIATDGREAAYFTRSLDNGSARRLDVSDNAVGSHWLAADGQGLIYNDIDTETYRKAPLTGGPSIAIAPTENSGGMRGLSESVDGRVAFASAHAGISLVDAPGGEAMELTSPEDGTVHSSPYFSPDGSLLFFSEVTGEDADPVVRVYDFASGEVKTLAPGEAPMLTASGYLLILRENALWAAPFDLEGAALRSSPVLVLEGIGREASSYAVAGNGTLVYVPELPAHLGNLKELVWVTRSGATESIPIALSGVEAPRISPDGTSVLIHASSLAEEDALNIWNHSFAKGTTSKLSFVEPPAFDALPSWGQDGNQFVYMQLVPPLDATSGSLFLGSADGARAPLQISDEEGLRQPTLIGDGRSLLAMKCTVAQSCDIAAGRLEADRVTVEVLLETPFQERNLELSPDGKWLAYTSDESGRFEVYVRPYPDLTARRWQVSTGGGQTPMWSKRGDELFFVQPSTNELLGVSVSGDETFNWTSPELVLDLETYDWGIGPNVARSFDISNDGERFLLVRQQEGVDHLVVVLSWLEEVKRLAPFE